MPDDQQFQVGFQVDVPPEMEAGVPAELATVWNTPNMFIIDFAAAKTPPQLQDDGSGHKQAVIPMRVVARVRVPPEQVFEIARALTQQLDKWETQTGRKPPNHDPLSDE